MLCMRSREGNLSYKTFRLIGPEVSTLDQITDLIRVGIDPLFLLGPDPATILQRAETYARNAWTGLEAELKDEEARREALMCL